MVRSELQVVILLEWLRSASWQLILSDTSRIQFYVKPFGYIEGKKCKVEIKSRVKLKYENQVRIYQ